MNEPIKNRDNDSPWTEVPEFVPTRHELVQLMKYWIEDILEIDFFEFVYTRNDVCLFIHRSYASDRINTIANYLDDATVERARNDAEGKFAKTVDPNAWQIFRHGTADEQQAFQTKLQEQLAKDFRRPREISRLASLATLPLAPA